MKTGAPTRIALTKVVAVGNDFFILDITTDPSLSRRDDYSALVRVACDRQRGPAGGADGLVLLDANNGVLTLRVINADGSDGGVSGNGARCAARLALHGNLIHSTTAAIPVQFPGRTLAVTFDRSNPAHVAIDMGAPGLSLPEIPVSAAHVRPVTDFEFKLDGLTVAFVSMGNPHMVLFTDASADLDAAISGLGPRYETHPAFPQRMNVHVARVASPTRVTIRSWERGVGRTLGCGTGSCATLVAGAITGRLERRATVNQPGGDVEIAWAADTGHVRLSGPVEIGDRIDIDWPRG
ncbi:MAG TPA: diaminopimelate epimerase [Phycisphaerales bacterium]|nr:diaminopimelate epimerase [Phycisphaerales bacterium]